MTEIVYIAAALLFALGTWDAFRRWVEASHARALAQDKNEQNQRAISILQTQCKLTEKSVEAQQKNHDALRMGLDECIVRLDTIKGQGWPTREQVRQIEEYARKELHAFDDEMRKFWKRLEATDQALIVTGGQVADLTQQVTGRLATQQTNRVRVGT